MTKESIFNKFIYPVENKSDFLDFIQQSSPALVVAANAKKVINTDAEYTKIFNRSITYPDGKTIVNFFNKKGYSCIKYPGYILWLDFIKKYGHEFSFYLVGAKTEVIEEVVKKLKKQFPTINITGFRNGYLEKADKQVLIEQLNMQKPDVVLVGTAYPQQEFLMNELCEGYPALYFGLGGSFNVYTDRVKAVPVWWEKYIGYESLYRLLQDPKKIKRQFANFKFLVYKYLGKL